MFNIVFYYYLYIDITAKHILYKSHLTVCFVISRLKNKNAQLFEKYAIDLFNNACINVETVSNIKDYCSIMKIQVRKL